MTAAPVSALNDDSEEDFLGMYDSLRSDAQKKIDSNCGGKENLKTALKNFEDIMKMPNTGLYEAKLKYEAIASARTYLDKTHKPKPRPFCAMRKEFKRALRKERNSVSKANGGQSCKAIVALNPTPTPAATATATSLATATPTMTPSAEQTVTPTIAPSAEPTVASKAEPTVAPSAEPTVVQPPAATPAPSNGDYPADFGVSREDSEDAE
ncbi:MAG: hypothetical protein RIR26_787 [Pseudomonadota bacterium]|jgi:hypothetical protein